MNLFATSKVACLWCGTFGSLPALVYGIFWPPLDLLWSTTAQADGAQSDSDNLLRRDDFWLLSSGGSIATGRFWECGSEGHAMTVSAQLCLFHSQMLVVGNDLSSISKKIMRSGRMAPSEWTRSVRAVRDTPVADYSTPGVNTTRRIVYHPPIAASLSLRILSVSYLKGSLRRCGQLWQYFGMISLGTHLHWHCNAMGDAANISPRVPSTCAQNAIFSLLIIHIIPSCQIYVGIDNPSLVPSVTCLGTSSHLWNDVRTADNISHAENYQSNGCQCCSHLYKFRDRIQVTWVFRYSGGRQG